MKPRLHLCAARSCNRQVPGHLLMCIEHWRMVPAPLARAVNRAWSCTALNPGDVLAARAHQVAVEQAVEAVAKKQEDKAAAAAAGSGDLFTS